MRIKERLKTNKILYCIFKKYENTKYHYLSKRNVKYRMNHKNENEKIRVAFICQYLPAWEKNKLIFSKMLKNTNFEPYIICLPFKNDNDTYSYICKQGFSSVINSVENGSYIDLKDYHFDYIFFERPYNVYLPEQFRPSYLSCFSKICFISYGFSLSKKLFIDLFKPDFIKFVDIFLADTENARDIYKSKFISRNEKYRYSEYVGYPGIEHMLNANENLDSAWNFAYKGKKVLWLPRWSVDSYGGGSNFFRYWELLLNYSNNHNIDLLLRPHPLMLSNFINKGLMNRTEVDQIMYINQKHKNVSIDNSSYYYTTLLKTDILIADFTSMIIEFICTKKPVIFCTSNVEWNLFDFADEMISCCYVANNSEELIKLLTMLENGNDPLKEKRESFVDNFLDDKMRYSSKAIVEVIENDFKKNR